MPEPPKITEGPIYHGKPRQFFKRAGRGAAQGLLGYGAYLLMNDPKYAALAPFILGPLGKALRLKYPNLASKIPF